MTSLEKKPTRSSRRLGAPTVADVARAASVSMMTVSRVLNGSATVKEETRASVLKAVAALDYKPNLAARTLAGARQIRLGLLLNDLGAGFLSSILVGCMTAANRNHVQVVVETAEGLDGALSGAANLIIAKVDGVILPPPLGEDPSIIGFFQAADVPMVALTASNPDPRTLAVHIDDDAAAEAMTRHLIALGHRRIGFINGTPGLSASMRRLSGYRRALAMAGIEIDDSLIAQGSYTYQSGLEAAEQLWAAEQPPTAIFAGNDDMAAATVAVAHRLGLDVPADITVCGFDDTVLATTIWPQLTTVRQPLNDMTQEAVAMLLEQLASPRGLPEDRRHRLVAFELIRRQSDSSPRRVPRPQGFKLDAS